jgi:hypothetical protein
MTGFTQPDDDTTLPMEAEESGNFSAARLYVMPVRPEDRLTPFPTRRRRNNVISMPLRGNYRSTPQYPGNALEYWPRGYPAHDDL